MASRPFATIETFALVQLAESAWNDPVALLDFERELAWRGRPAECIAADLIGTRVALLRTLMLPVAGSNPARRRLCPHGCRTRATCRICTPTPYDRGYWAS